MDLSVNNLLNLDNNKSYYMTQDNQIKESGIFHKIKCFFNIGDARGGTQRLIQAVKTALEESTGLSNNAALETDLKAVSGGSDAKGSALKQIALKFNADNIDNINRHKVRQATSELITSKISDLVKADDRIKDTPQLRALFFKASEKLINLYNLPAAMKDENGNIDMTLARSLISQRIDEIGVQLLNLSLKNIVIDGFYAEYIASKVLAYSNPVPFEELKSGDEAFADTIKEKIIPAERGSQDVQDTIDYLKQQIKENPELASILTDNRIKLMVRGDNKPRSLESVKERVENIKSELQSLESFTNPKIFDFGKTCLNSLHGTKVKEETLFKLASHALKFDLSPLLSVNSGSSELDIYNAFKHVHENYLQMVDQLDLHNKELYEGRDEDAAFRAFFFNCALSRLDAPHRETLMKTLESTQNSRLVTYLNDAENNEIAKSKNKVDEYNIYCSDLSYDITFMKSSLSSQMGIEFREISFYIPEINIDSTLRTITDDILKKFS